MIILAMKGSKNYLHQRNQGLVLTLTQEIKKSVNDSMDGIVSGLRNEVAELHSELQSIKDSQPQTFCAPKHGRLPRVLLVSFSDHCSKIVLHGSGLLL